MIEGLIEHGVNVDAVDTDQRTALHYAAWNNNAEAIDAPKSKNVPLLAMRLLTMFPTS